MLCLTASGALVRRRVSACVWAAATGTTWAVSVFSSVTDQV